jgi:putative membrane protein
LLSKREDNIVNSILAIIVSWIITAVILLIIDRLNVGIRVESFGIALLAALVIAVLNAVLGTILRLLALPLNLITLFLLSWLISWVITAIILYAAAKIVRGFEIKSFGSALIGALVMAILNWGADWLLQRIFG